MLYLLTYLILCEIIYCFEPRIFIHALFSVLHAVVTVSKPGRSSVANLMEM
jgi:hypothetical protein